MLHTLTRAFIRTDDVCLVVLTHVTAHEGREEWEREGGRAETRTTVLADLFPRETTNGRVYVVRLSVGGMNQMLEGLIRLMDGWMT